MKACFAIAMLVALIWIGLVQQRHSAPPLIRPTTPRPSVLQTNASVAPAPGFAPLPVFQGELKPFRLPPREAGRVLNPTREEVQAIIARMKQGQDNVPEFLTLASRLIALDFRDYPEEYAEMVCEEGYLHYVGFGKKHEFRANDNPRFLAAVLAYLHRLVIGEDVSSLGYLGGVQLLAYMTNSPALIPELVGALKSPKFGIASSCAASLSYLPQIESAVALVEHAKQVGPPSEDPEANRGKTFVYQDIARLRNPELIPYLEKELTQATDAALVQHLKFAILANREGLPAQTTEEVWKATWQKVAEWK